MLPQHHHHDGYQYQCIELVDDVSIIPKWQEQYHWHNKNQKLLISFYGFHLEISIKLNYGFLSWINETNFLCVVKSTSPIDTNISLLLVEFYSSGNTSSSWYLTKFKKSVKNRTIFSYIEPLHLLLIIVHVIGSNVPKNDENKILFANKYSYFKNLM